MRVRVLVVAALGTMLLSSCSGGTDDQPTTPTRRPLPAPGPAVTVLNLNAAMGYHMGRGDPAGTDATPEDLADLADDILSRDADIANLQEMAKPAAEELRAILARQTGHEWQLNWAHSGNATYYPGKEEGEDPTYLDVSAGNAQLVRIGAGIRAQQVITLDGPDKDQGFMLPSGGRSFAGAELITNDGVVDVYVAHLARVKDASDGMRARDVQDIQKLTESRSNPAIVTGDFNQVIDNEYGEDFASRETVIALRSFVNKYGYTDIARDLGPTSNQKSRFLASLRIDYILARGVQTRDTARFESHQSDHWGLVTTIDGVAGNQVDMAFQGRWRSPAPVLQPTSDKTYWVELTISAGPAGARVGDVLYPGLDCSGSLTLVEARPDKLVVTERIDREPNHPCLKEGTVTLVPTAAGLDYSYVPAGDPKDSATAALVRS